LARNGFQTTAQLGDESAGSFPTVHDFAQPQQPVKRLGDSARTQDEDGDVAAPLQIVGDGSRDRPTADDDEVGLEGDEAFQTGLGEIADLRQAAHFGRVIARRTNADDQMTCAEGEQVFRRSGSKRDDAPNLRRQLHHAPQLIPNRARRRDWQRRGGAKASSQPICAKPPLAPSLRSRLQTTI